MTSSDLVSPAPGDDSRAAEREQRLERLIRRLPAWVQKVTRWLRRPSFRAAENSPSIGLHQGETTAMIPVIRAVS